MAVALWVGDLLSSPVTKGFCVVKCSGQLRDHCTTVGRCCIVETEEQKCRESIRIESWALLQRRNWILVQLVAVLLKVRLCAYTCGCWWLKAALEVCFQSILCENDSYCLQFRSSLIYYSIIILVVSPRIV